MIRQRGATAVEFALVFPMLFILFYSVVVYSYLFVLQESISFAAQESASAVHQVNPVGRDKAEFDEAVKTQACERAGTALDWLPETLKTRVLGQCVKAQDCSGSGETGVRVCIDDATNVVRVNLGFDVNGLFPVLRMPLLGELPPMPERLLGTGTALVGDS